MEKFAKKNSYLSFQLTILILTILTLFSLCSNLKADTIPLQLIMTEDQMKKTGIQSLTPQQQKAFNDWLEGYTKQVIDQAPTYHPSKTVGAWIQGWPKYMLAKGATQQSQQELNKERQKDNMRIDKNRNEGETIELKDGSVWQVGVTYRFISRRWRRDEAIEISQSENILLPYTLHNVNRDELVQAKQISPPSPTGEKAQEPTSYFQGATTVNLVRGHGAYLDLANGSSWKIAPADQTTVRHWKKDDRVRIEKQDLFIYQYAIQNLDSGETALANPLNQNP